MPPKAIRLILSLSIGLNLAFLALIGLLLFSPEIVLSMNLNQSGRAELREKIMRSRMQGLGREIGLSEEQKSRIWPIMDRAFEAVDASERDIRSIEHDIMLHLLRTPEDEDGLETRMTRLHQEYEQTGRHFLDAAKQALPHLAPEQIAQLERMAHARREASNP